jgi:O-antigen/teichoic acid export membrane protein
VLAVTACATFAALAALTVHSWRVFAYARSSSPDYSAVGQWFAVGLPLLAMGFALELLNQVEVIILGIIANAREAGLFAAAWRLASMVVLALSTFGLVCGPVVASAYHRGDFDELNGIAQFAARLTAASAAVAIGVLIVGGKLLLSIFGPEFGAAYPALLALLAGGAVNAGTGIVAYLLTLTGHERVAALIFAVALFVSIALNLLLIPLFGALGAAIASSATLSAWNLAMVVYVRRVFGIDATVLGRRLRRVHRPAAGMSALPPLPEP